MKLVNAEKQKQTETKLMPKDRKKALGKSKVAPDISDQKGSKNRDVSDALKLMNDTQNTQPSETPEANAVVEVETRQHPAILTDQEYHASAEIDDFREPPQDCWEWLLSKPPPPPKPWCAICIAIRVQKIQDSC